MTKLDEKSENNAVIGLVLFTHAGLGGAFIDAVEMVAGSQQNLLAVAVDQGVRPNELERVLDDAIKEADNGLGVVVMTDLFGGSPANLSLARMIPGKVEVVSGLNLAMLLKAVDLRNRALADPSVLARAVVREGRENIALASDLLSERDDLRLEVSAGGAD